MNNHDLMNLWMRSIFGLFDWSEFNWSESIKKCFPSFWNCLRCFWPKIFEVGSRSGSAQIEPIRYSEFSSVNRTREEFDSSWPEIAQWVFNPPRIPIKSRSNSGQMGSKEVKKGSNLGIDGAWVLLGLLVYQNWIFDQVVLHLKVLEVLNLELLPENVSFHQKLFLHSQKNWKNR